ncbi:response regulator [Paenibacillus methanolicus]|uniref:response regulator n=1 Tax=Paenibacillus methanolicus TaxID=582686 RepID=UPI001FE82A05|nr:response regulator [Paenibacillus methanolicus]
MTIDNRTVLVVDDDADIRRMIGIYLHQAGLVAITANDAEDALRQLTDHPVGSRTARHYDAGSRRIRIVPADSRFFEGADHARQREVGGLGQSPRDGRRGR